MKIICLICPPSVFHFVNVISFSQVIGDASHLSGYSFSAHNNIIHPSAELGSKTTVSLASHLPELYSAE